MGMLVGLVIIVAFGVLAYSYFRKHGGRRFFSQQNNEAQELAKRRYANGEISREEFEQIKRDLEDEGSVL